MVFCIYGSLQQGNNKLTAIISQSNSCKHLYLCVPLYEFALFGKLREYPFYILLLTVFLLKLFNIYTYHC